MTGPADASWTSLTDDERKQIKSQVRYLRGLLTKLSNAVDAGDLVEAANNAILIPPPADALWALLGPHHGNRVMREAAIRRRRAERGASPDASDGGQP